MNLSWRWKKTPNRRVGPQMADIRLLPVCKKVAWRSWLVSETTRRIKIPPNSRLMWKPRRKTVTEKHRSEYNACKRRYERTMFIIRIAEDSIQTAENVSRVEWPKEHIRFESLNVQRENTVQNIRGASRRQSEIDRSKRAEHPSDRSPRVQRL